jgi:GNAT superfamily N-acetyltransferase
MTAPALDRLSFAEVDPRSDGARLALSQYYAELGRRFARGFDVTQSRDPDAADMIRPRGAFVLASIDGAAVGCVGLKGDGGASGEIKRLWVAPSARGLGLARRLMDAAEQAARELGMDVLRLDTNSALPEAAALYLKTGWREIERFNDDPYPDMFFEKRLA